MTRGEAVRRRLEGLWCGCLFALSGVSFWAAAYEPGERVKPHHSPPYGTSVILGIIAFLFFVVAVTVLFAKPPKGDRP